MDIMQEYNVRHASKLDMEHSFFFEIFFFKKKTNFLRICPKNYTLFELSPK